jgi:hypothetical protein
MLMNLAEHRPKALLADKGYHSNSIRDGLKRRGIKPVIPPKQTASKQSAITRNSTKPEMVLNGTSVSLNRPAVSQHATIKQPPRSSLSYAWLP